MSESEHPDRADRIFSRKLPMVLFSLLLSCQERNKLIDLFVILAMNFKKVTRF